jgi:uncharacterized SAM-binding protein YcdF (DUF218 family)
MQGRLILCRALALFALSWLIAVGYMIAQIPHITANPSIHTDGIVVLTGPEVSRVSHGLDLFEAGDASHLLISGLQPGMTEQAVFRWARRPGLVPSLGIALGETARTTLGNVQETQQWACTMHPNSIRLITANYHMPRALWLLHHALPHVLIIPDSMIEVDKRGHIPSLLHRRRMTMAIIDATKDILQHLAYFSGLLPDISPVCSFD